MQVFKYHTTVSNRGELNLPVGTFLSNKEVEVIVVTRKESENLDKSKISFVDKWAGFLKDSDMVADPKMEYLSQKYK